MADIGLLCCIVVGDFWCNRGRLYVLFLGLETLTQDADVHGPRMLKLPIFGAVIEKATIARWTRTLATMFAAGVPLVEALESVGGAAG